MVRASYEIVPEYEAFVRATRHVRSYESLQGGDRFDRDSDGWELVAGTALDLGGVVFGEVFAGWRTQDYDDPRLPAVDGPSFGGRLIWNVTPLTTVGGFVQRTVEESTLGGASGFLATAAGVGVDHELLRNLILGAELEFTNNDYEGIRRDDDLLGVGIGGTWLVNRNVRAELGYRFDTRDSTVSGAGYDSQIVTVTVRLQY